MCGISVIVDHAGLNRDWLERLSRDRLSLSHRGPDDTSAVRVGSHAVIRAWRLAVRNSQSGAQPLTFPDGSVLACNGEWYGSPHEIRGLRSDVEVLYSAYRDGGAAALANLDGMFAGVLYYAPEDRFIAFRDRHGVKPLFLLNARGASIVSSEVKGLVAVTGTTPEYDRAFASECLIHGHSLKRSRSPYGGIRQVAPGEVLELCQEPRALVAGERGYLVADDPNVDGRPSWEALLEVAIQSICAADAAPAVLLSGGVDSSLIADFTTRNRPKLVRCGIVARFPNAGPQDVARDESAYAKFVAERCGLQTLETDVTGPRTPAELEPIFAALEQPMFNSSPVVTHDLAECLANNGIRCVLSGDGLDELRFAYRRLRAYGPSESGHALDLTPYADDLVPLPESFYRRIACDDLAIAFKRRAAAIAAALTRQGFSPLPNALRAMEIELRLPNYHLARIDRLFMARGVEARVPFLRRDLVSAAMTRTSTSDHLEPAKLAERRILSKRFGAQIAWRPKVRFSGPVHTWVDGWFAGASPEEYIRSSVRVRELTRGSELAALFKEIRSLGLSTERSLIVWGLACIAAWEQSERRWGTAGCLDKDVRKDPIVDPTA